MDVDEAIDPWVEKKMSTKEVLMATGLRRLQDIYQEIVYDRIDLENEEELEMHPTVELERQEQMELEALAWHQWQHLLQERPEYLESCVRQLRQERVEKLSLGRPKKTAEKSLN